MKIFFIILGVVAALIATIIMYVVATSPPTYIISGSQLPPKYQQTIETLELLEKGETVELFYSDGFLSIEEGMYFLTDRHLILYSKDWEEVKGEIIPYVDIQSSSIEYEKSFLLDSTIYFSTEEYDFEFPVSSEKKGDRQFYQLMQQKIEQAKGE